MSSPWGILIGEAEKLETEAVVSVVEDEDAADVVNAASVNAAADAVVDVDCGWSDDARA